MTHPPTPVIPAKAGIHEFLANQYEFGPGCGDPKFFVEITE